MAGQSSRREGWPPGSGEACCSPGGAGVRGQWACAQGAGRSSGKPGWTRVCPRAGSPPSLRHSPSQDHREACQRRTHDAADRAGPVREQNPTHVSDFVIQAQLSNPGDQAGRRTAPGFAADRLSAPLGQRALGTASSTLSSCPGPTSPVGLRGSGFHWDFGVHWAPLGLQSSTQGAGLPPCLQGPGQWPALSLPQVPCRRGGMKREGELVNSGWRGLSTAHRPYFENNFCKDSVRKFPV